MSPISINTSRVASSSNYKIEENEKLSNSNSIQSKPKKCVSSSQSLQYEDCYKKKIENKVSCEASTPKLLASPCNVSTKDKLEATLLLATQLNDVVIGLMALNSQLSEIQTKDNILNSKEINEKQKDKIIERHKAIEKQLKELEKAARWGFWGKLFKWIGVAIAAVASTVGAIFTGGSSLAIGSLIITAILATEEISKAVTEELVEKGILGKEVASWIRMALGNPDDFMDNTVARALPPEIREKFKKAIHIIHDIGRTVVSIVGTGGAATAHAIMSAQSIAKQIADTLAEEGIISKEDASWIKIGVGDLNGVIERIGLSIIADKEEREQFIMAMRIIDSIGEAIASYCMGGGKGEKGSTSSVGEKLKLGTQVAKATTDAVRGGMELQSELASISAKEAEVQAKKSSAEMKRLQVLQEEIMEKLEEIMEHQDKTRETVISMLKSIESARQTVISI